MKYTMFDPKDKTEKLKKKISAIKLERIPDNDPDTSYLEQEGFEDRLEKYNNGDFSFIGIRAKAGILIPKGQSYLYQEITSGGLWGIESDSDESYFREMELEELRDLKDTLFQLGFTVNEIDKEIQEAMEE